MVPGMAKKAHREETPEQVVLIAHVVPVDGAPGYTRVHWEIQFSPVQAAFSKDDHGQPAMEPASSSH